jgi:hypothetical protein
LEYLKLALKLYEAINKQEAMHPKAAFLSSYVTMGDKVLHHGYSTHKQTYKALACPPFSKADHDSILLLPVYKQKLVLHFEGYATRRLC